MGALHPATARRFLGVIAASSAAACASDASGPSNSDTNAPPAAVAAITLSPATAALLVGDTLRLNVTLTDASGKVLSGRAIAFATSDANVATVTPDGLVRGVATGVATITAASDARTGAAEITVIAATLPDFVALAVDTVGTIGENPAVAVSSTGAVHLTYYDMTTSRMKYAGCVSACGTTANWTTGQVGTANSSGRWSSIVVDGSARVHVAYNGAASRDDLGYMTCTANCASPAGWQQVVVDTTGNAGAYLQLALDDKGGLHIAYQGGQRDMRYAFCARDCLSAASWQSTAVDTAGDLATFGARVTVALDGRVHLSYRDDSNGNLKYATCASACAARASWQVANITTGPDDEGRGNSIAVDEAGHVWVAYADVTLNDLMLASCAGNCGSAAAWNTVTLDTVRVGAFLSMAADARGVLHIGYYANNSGLGVRYARCAHNCQNAAAWMFRSVETSSTGSFGWFTNLAASPAGRVSITHMDQAKGDLRYAESRQP